MKSNKLTKKLYKIERCKGSTFQCCWRRLSQNAIIVDGEGWREGKSEREVVGGGGDTESLRCKCSRKCYNTS